jgi:hypothetical protein
MPIISNLACVTGWGKNNADTNYIHQTRLLQAPFDMLAFCANGNNS